MSLSSVWYCTHVAFPSSTMYIYVDTVPSCGSLLGSTTRSSQTLLHRLGWTRCVLWSYRLRYDTHRLTLCIARWLSQGHFRTRCLPHRSPRRVDEAIQWCTETGRLVSDCVSVLFCEADMRSFQIMVLLSGVSYSRCRSSLYHNILVIEPHTHFSFQPYRILAPRNVFVWVPASLSTRDSVWGWYILYQGSLRFCSDFSSRCAQTLICQCLEAAKSVIRNMIEKLAPSGYMRFSADGTDPIHWWSEDLG